MIKLPPAGGADAVAVRQIQRQQRQPAQMLQSRVFDKQAGQIEMPQATHASDVLHGAVINVEATRKANP